MSGSFDTTIRLWDAANAFKVNVIEGHTNAVAAVSFSADRRLIASKGCDHTVRIWHCESHQLIAVISAPMPANWVTGLAFHTHASILATLGDDDKSILIWDFNSAIFLRTLPLTPIIRYTSGKIVIVGESNVGKSCLAMRLAECRYPGDHEQGTTHGMRFWKMGPEQLSPYAVAPEDQRRDVILWDLGGQDEYRLVHQLFLHDTTMALVLMDPTRGRTAFEEVEAWNKRLDKQLGEGKAIKLLIGSKMDEPSALVDRIGIDQLCRHCGFAKYFEISSKYDRGISELREAISNAMDWEALAKTSRPELFQRIRDEIERRSSAGEVVLTLGELETTIYSSDRTKYEPDAVAAVAEQLATQGLIALTRLASGERVLVLQISQIERYAGSLIVAARKDTRGVAALEEQLLASPEVPLPGINDERLPRLQERVVLECVTQLLIEHGICFPHEGLLVFPSLFRATSAAATPFPKPSHFTTTFRGRLITFMLR